MLLSQERESGDQGHWCQSLQPVPWQWADTKAGIGCAQIQGQHPLKAAFKDRISHSDAPRLSRFKGIFKCSLEMHPSFAALQRIRQLDPSQIKISHDSLVGILPSQLT